MIDNQFLGWETVKDATAGFYTTPLIITDEICVDGGQHYIDYRKGGTAGKPNEYEIACIKCGKIFKT